MVQPPVEPVLLVSGSVGMRVPVSISGSEAEGAMMEKREKNESIDVLRGSR